MVVWSRMPAWALLWSILFRLVVTSESGSHPIVGILTQPISFVPGRTTERYIGASYVKWLESAGAQSIPIPYEADFELIDDLLSQINGLLLPGGNYNVNDSVKYLLDQVVKRNEAGNFFPVWGTCMGFENLVEYGSPGSLQWGFDAENITLPLEGLVSHDLYVDEAMVASLSHHPITMNNHQRGIEPDQFYSDSKLTALWNVTSINHDRKGRPFVSTIEPINPELFPFYGVQYHPEKNSFEYAFHPGTTTPYEVIDHSEEGVLLSFSLARFFVNLARRNTAATAFTGRFALVQTYPMEYGIKFEQFYITAVVPNPLVMDAA